MIRLMGLISIICLMSGCYTTDGGYSSGYYSTPARVQQVNIPQDIYLHTPDINSGGIQNLYGNITPLNQPDLVGSYQQGLQFKQNSEMHKERLRAMQLQNALLEQQLRGR